MDLARMRRQDGFVREVVKYFALFVVLLVLILDAVAVIQVQSSVRSHADDAGQAAITTYIETGDLGSAQAAAEQHIVAVGDRFISAKVSLDADGGVVATVAAERTAKTYVYHFATRLPYVGDRIAGLLGPTVMRTMHQ